MIPLALAPHEVRAAEETHDLYSWNGDLLTRQPGKWVSLCDDIAADSNPAIGYLIAKDSDGKYWSFHTDEHGIVSNRTQVKDCGTAMSNPSWPITTMRVPGHGDMESVSHLVANSRSTASGQLLNYSAVSVDTDGSAWYDAANSTYFPGTIASTTPLSHAVSRFRPDLVFHDLLGGTAVTGGNDYANPVNFGALFLARPRATAQSASIAQVPVTGAPASDMVLPAVIVAASILGVGFMATRRRRV